MRLEGFLLSRPFQAQAVIVSNDTAGGTNRFRSHIPSIVLGNQEGASMVYRLLCRLDERLQRGLLRTECALMVALGLLQFAGKYVG